jgi:hypothetical protein
VIVSRSTVYLRGWLTLQWLISGPLFALLAMEMFFSDSHGLPSGNAWMALPYLLIITGGYVMALRFAKGSEDRD